MKPDDSHQIGLIVASHGRHYLAELSDGRRLQAFPRSKKSIVAVGDHVELEETAPAQAAIIEIAERRNLLYRSDQFKVKLLASNVDQLVIVLATEPRFSEDLLGRALVAAEALSIDALIVLNKIDLSERLDAARQRLLPYATFGYLVLEVSAKTKPEATLARLCPLLAGRANILLGQSGMGKSSLLNLLIPDASAQTREISEKLDSGKHTTTFTRLYHLNGGGALIDSPGFQEFGLHHLSEGQLERAFPEFRPRLGQCRFYNCHHLHEPGCPILQGVEAGAIGARRHQLYAQLLHESQQRKPY